MDILIRKELPADYHSSEEMIKKAFLNEEYSGKTEHFLVKRISNSDSFIPELSLVALTQAKGVAGVILLSKITIGDGGKDADSLALAPVSVAPGYQGKGICRQLIRTTLNKAKMAGFQSVIVLGQTVYYPKFGIKPAFGISRPRLKCLTKCSWLWN
ncbi:putative N-acetyltransferase YhbS [Cytobacillus firmus]|uniref:Putative N-acetyltransferase YhbS n=2 Tax=Cytobacillus TaxID=2675230 RepID=A0A366JQZ0_CYTFI|nr:putative N-acetyltransferase YhbS [Cytobacillus firmus]TDX40419.1 putative N-acetyltransferase YhbS [Cytobacillus oceanisediminis]